MKTFVRLKLKSAKGMIGAAAVYMSQRPRAYVLLDARDVRRRSAQRRPVGNSAELLVVAKPPRRAEQLLFLILSKDDRIHMIGDLAEEHAELQLRHGLRFANLWYWKQATFSLGPLARKAIRWGLLIFAEEWARRLIR